jgi:hypothetical protein
LFECKQFRKTEASEQNTFSSIIILFLSGMEKFNPVKFELELMICMQM